MAKTIPRTIELETTCVGIGRYEWERLMEGARRADKRKINQMVRQQHPEIFNGLSLNLRNPYNYFKTKTHYILVHSGIEYFFAIC